MLSKTKFNFTPLLLGALWIATSIFFVKSNWKPLFEWNGRTDLEIVTHAASNLFNGQEVYVEDDLWQHTKPPVATMLFIPLSFIDSKLLENIWDLINIAALFLLSWFITKLLIPQASTIKKSIIACLGIICVTNFYLYELRYGQYNMITLCFVFAAAQLKTQSVGSTLFSVATFIKPTNILFLPWVLKAQDNSKLFFLKLTSATLILFIFYGIFFGFQNLIDDHLRWSEFIKASTEKYLYRDVNYGIPSAVSSYTSSKALHKALLLIGLMMSAYCSKKLPLVLSFAAAAIISLAVSPMTWWANFCILLPASIWICLNTYTQIKKDKKISKESILDLVILYSGTQLIFPNYLPDFIILNYPRMANPVWVYLIYLAKEIWKHQNKIFHKLAA